MSNSQDLDRACTSNGTGFNLSVCVMLGLKASVVALIIFHLCTFAILPVPFLDEAWFIARARGFAEHGYPFGMLDSGVFDRLPSYRYFFPYLPTALQAIPFLVSDEPNLVASRLLSLACGFIIVYCVYLISRWASGAYAALLSAALLLSSSFFLFSSHVARIDSEAAAVGMIGLTLILTNQTGTWWRLVVGGFLAGVAVEFHPHAAVITAPALVAAMTVGGSIRERALSLLWTFIGCFLSGLTYAALHVVPDPDAFLAFQRIAFAPTHTPPILTFNALMILNGIYEAFLSFFNHGIVGPLVCLLLYIGGLAVTTGRARTLGLLAGVATLSCGVLIRHKFGYYNIYFQPLTLAFAAAVLTSAFTGIDEWSLPRRIAGRIVQGCAGGLCVPIVIGLPSVFLPAFHNITSGNPLPDLSAYIRPDDIVLGNQTYWLAVPNVGYLSPEHLIYYTRWKSGASVTDALRDLRPTVIIQDDHMRNFLTYRDEGCPYICFPDDGLDRLIASSDLIAEIPSEAYGELRLYRPRGSY